MPDKGLWDRTKEHTPLGEGVHRLLMTAKGKRKRVDNTFTKGLQCALLVSDPYVCQYKEEFYGRQREPGREIKGGRDTQG